MFWSMTSAARSREPDRLPLFTALPPNTTPAAVAGRGVRAMDDRSLESGPSPADMNTVALPSLASQGWPGGPTFDASDIGSANVQRGSQSPSRRSPHLTPKCPDALVIFQTFLNSCPLAKRYFPFVVCSKDGLSVSGFRSGQLTAVVGQLRGRTVRCARAVHALCARCAKSWLFSTTGSSVSSED